MPVTIIISNDLTDDWATDEQLREMTDAEIVALVKEDVTAFLEGACFIVERPARLSRPSSCCSGVGCNSCEPQGRG